jgi:hypothetical protein
VETAITGGSRLAAEESVVPVRRCTTPIAYGSMPSSYQVVTCRTSASFLASRVRTATIFGRRPFDKTERHVGAAVAASAGYLRSAVDDLVVFGHDPGRRDAGREG